MPTSVKNSLLEDARRRCDDAIESGFASTHPVLIDALPAMGKSSGVIRWAARTGKKVSIFTARHDLYDQYIEWCEDEEIPADQVKRLPSFQNDCPSAAGDYDDPEEDHQRKLSTRIDREYNRGWSGVDLHAHPVSLLGEPLPCNHSSTCPYLENRDYDPGDYQVLIGHYTHAYVERNVGGRYVAIDEFPEKQYIQELSSDAVNSAITVFLRLNDDLPWDNQSSLKEYLLRNNDGELRQEALEWFENHKKTLYPDTDLQNRLHPYAGIATYVRMIARKLDTDWEVCQSLPYGRKAVIEPGKETMFVLERPTLQPAESVIALDGTPTFEKWSLILGSDLEHDKVLADEERHDYLREALQLRIIQTSEEAKPYLGRDGISLTPDKDLALIEGIKHREGMTPSLITSYAALGKYRLEGLDNLIEEVEDKTDHFLAMKGMNRFATHRLGVVIGSLHKGDDEVSLWAGFHGVSVERTEDDDGEVTRGMDLDYGDFGNRLLHDMRENQVLQAIMRFGRTEESGVAGATVYVHTAALPQWVEPEKAIPEFQTFKGQKGGKRRIIEAIRSQDDWNSATWCVADVHDWANAMDEDDSVEYADTVSVEQVRKHLKWMREAGLIAGEQGGRGNAWRLWNVHLEDAGHFGYVNWGSADEADTVLG